MTGNRRAGLVLQERDRHLLSELGVMRIVDRETAKVVAGFGSTTRTNTRFTRSLKVGALSRLDTSVPLAALLAEPAGAGDWAGVPEEVVSVFGAAAGSGGAWARRAPEKNKNPAVRSSPIACRSNRTCLERPMRSSLCPCWLPLGVATESKETTRRRPVLRLYARVYLSTTPQRTRFWIAIGLGASGFG